MRDRLATRRDVLLSAAGLAGAAAGGAVLAPCLGEDPAPVRVAASSEGVRQRERLRRRVFLPWSLRRETPAVYYDY